MASAPASAEPNSPRRGGYVFAGGGTGGHLFPAIAVARELLAREPTAPVLFVGSDRPIERKIVAQANFDHRALSLESSVSMRRRPFRFLRSLRTACRDAKRLLMEIRPRVVVGCGGFASVPASMAAWRLGIPLVLLEQNVLPGRATRWLSRIADAVCLSFEETAAWLPRRSRCIVTGNPVRPEVASLPARMSTPAATRTLLVLGGSLGSQGLNRGVLAGLAADPGRWRDWSIVHQTGATEFETMRDHYALLPLQVRVEPFLDDVPTLLATATLAVSRAGATTLGELACAGVPTVAVPWKEARDDHQTWNARWYADRRAMRLGMELGEAGGLNPVRLPSFWSDVTTLAGDGALRDQLSTRLLELARPDAAQRVLDVLDGAARERSAVRP